MILRLLSCLILRIRFGLRSGRLRLLRVGSVLIVVLPLKGRFIRSL